MRSFRAYNWYNIATLCDGYKLDHRRQYPPNTTCVQSNWTSRASRVPGHRKVIYLAGQFFRQKYLVEDFAEFFGESENAVAARYARRINGYLGPNKIGTDHIRQLHRLGYVPLLFRNFREGTAVPLRVPMFTVENTHDDFAWMTNYFETLMSSVMWMPCTSATTALGYRRILDDAAEKTGSPKEFVNWQGHDFSFRGMPGPEAACLSAMGHLLYFTGTDTVPALDLIEKYYGGMAEDYLIGGSVNATEHSVMCAGGEDGELNTINRLLDLYEEGILSIVSDTWDLWRLITVILPQVKARIMGRNGKVVIRPDSGDPVDILCGDPSAPPDSPAFKGVVELLWDIFGGTITSTGHRLLDQHIGCIYGDSITPQRARAITERLAAKNFASADVVFGIGSFTYQYVTRDTYGTAMKATWAKIDGKPYNLYKAPKTDNGIKFSACGRLAVDKDDRGEYRLIEKATPEQEAASYLVPSWRDGVELIHERYDLMRAVAQLALTDLREAA
jgi:nicotinamide phosphoribosyltransferase